MMLLQSGQLCCIYLVSPGLPVACDQSNIIVFGLVYSSSEGYTAAGHVQSFWQASGRPNDFIPPSMRTRHHSSGMEGESECMHPFESQD